MYFPKERATRRRRPFCFVTFDSHQAAERAVAESNRVIEVLPASRCCNGARHLRRGPILLLPDAKRIVDSSATELGSRQQKWLPAYGLATVSTSRVLAGIVHAVLSLGLARVQSQTSIV